jgi:plastocyanin
VFSVPPGYGYQSRADDKWLMTWMVMNHRKQTDRAYIQYKVTYETTPQTPVKPYWLDVRNCKADPVFDAPGGGKPGSRFTTSDTWTAPESGRLVSIGGHVHGGAYKLGLTQPGCSDRTLTDIRPAWGSRKHPFYNVKPILHEPGPIATSGVLSRQGFPLAKGEQVKLSAVYDNERPHTRAMGIAIAYMAPDAGVAAPCGARPTDTAEYQTTKPHRKRPPRFRVPLTGLDARGHAVTIQRPRGKVRTMARGGTIRVKDFQFSRPNVVVRRGSTLRWRFDDSELHNITLADGPRGFSSPHLSDGRKFSKRLSKKGTYKLFCGLHPVSMTETVKVR